jgi:hypothetical protein
MIPLTNPAIVITLNNSVILMSPPNSVILSESRSFAKAKDLLSVCSATPAGNSHDNL